MIHCQKVSRRIRLNIICSNKILIKKNSFSSNDESTDNKEVKPKRKKNKEFDEANAQSKFIIDRANLFVMKYKEIEKRKIDFTKEEQEEIDRITLEYNRQSSKLKNKYDFDFANKSWLQGEAMRALPEHLRSHAMTIDTSPVPDRPFPKWHTPPIKGFKMSDYVKGSDLGEENN